MANIARSFIGSNSQNTSESKVLGYLSLEYVPADIPVYKDSPAGRFFSEMLENPDFDWELWGVTQGATFKPYDPAKSKSRQLLDQFSKKGVAEENIPQERGG